MQEIAPQICLACGEALAADTVCGACGLGPFAVTWTLQHDSARRYWRGFHLLALAPCVLVAPLLVRERWWLIASVVAASLVLVGYTFAARRFYEARRIWHGTIAHTLTEAYVEMRDGAMFAAAGSCFFDHRPWMPPDAARWAEVDIGDLAAAHGVALRSRAENRNDEGYDWFLTTAAVVGLVARGRIRARIVRGRLWWRGRKNHDASRWSPPSPPHSPWSLVTYDEWVLCPPFRRAKRRGVYEPVEQMVFDIVDLPESEHSPLERALLQRRSGATAEAFAGSYRTSATSRLAPRGDHLESTPESRMRPPDGWLEIPFDSIVTVEGARPTISLAAFEELEAALVRVDPESTMLLKSAVGDRRVSPGR